MTNRIQGQSGNTAPMYGLGVEQTGLQYNPSAAQAMQLGQGQSLNNKMMMLGGCMGSQGAVQSNPMMAMISMVVAPLIQMVQTMMGQMMSMFSGASAASSEAGGLAGLGGVAAPGASDGKGAADGKKGGIWQQLLNKGVSWLGSKVGDWFGLGDKATDAAKDVATETTKEVADGASSGGGFFSGLVDRAGSWFKGIGDTISGWFS